MLIPIPIGEKITVVVEGSVWKFVCCANCREKYAYLVKLKAVGSDDNLLFLDSKGCTNRAHSQAEENLASIRRNIVLPVPCPRCGFYQDDMVQRVKDEGMGNRIAISGLAIAVLSFIPLAFRIPYLWVMTVIGVSIGLSMIAYADVSAARFNPNDGDPETRKAEGQKQAVWGPQLTELLATIPNAEDASDEG